MVNVASGAGFWLERIGDCDVCAIPIVREVVPTDVNIRVRRIRPSAVRERRSWAIGGRRTCPHSCSSASRFYAATATLPCRSKPSRCAWRGPGLGALVIAIPRTRRLTGGGLVRRRAAHRGHRRLVRRRDRARRAGGVADRRRPRRRRSPAVVGRAAGRVSRLIEADLGTGRMEAFSDGVIAIIITIMVLAGGAVPTERLLTSLPRCRLRGTGAIPATEEASVSHQKDHRDEEEQVADAVDELLSRPRWSARSAVPTPVLAKGRVKSLFDPGCGDDDGPKERVQDPPPSSSPASIGE